MYRKIDSFFDVFSGMFFSGIFFCWQFNESFLDIFWELAKTRQLMRLAVNLGVDYRGNSVHHMLQFITRD